MQAARLLVVVVAVMMLAAPAVEGAAADNLLLDGAAQPIAQLGLRLLAATLQAIATDGSPLDASPEADAEPPSGEVAWRVAVRELARVVLQGGRLEALLVEPALVAAIGEQLRGVHCASAASDDDHAAAAMTPPLLVRNEPRPRRAPEPPRGEPRRVLRHELPLEAQDGFVAPPLPPSSDSTAPVGLPALRLSAGSCSAHADCDLGEYCDFTFACSDCSSIYVSPTTCNVASGDCCSAAFLAQCKANPAGCCTRDGDCPGTQQCVEPTFLEGWHCEAKCTADAECAMMKYCSKSTNRCEYCSMGNNSPTSCDDISGDCCSTAFLTQCGWMGGGMAHCDLSCSADVDCAVGSYCGSDNTCTFCSFLADPLRMCDDISGDCCSAAILAQCADNPAECCGGDSDCPVGHGHCVDGRCDGKCVVDADCPGIQHCYSGSCEELPSGKCTADAGCTVGKYCSKQYYEVGAGSCSDCSSWHIGPTWDDVWDARSCDDISGDCCSAAFLTQCPDDPADCTRHPACERDVDCPAGEYCWTVSHQCNTPTAQGVALLAGFVRDPRTAAAWGALTGWNNASDPCGTPKFRPWDGVKCEGAGGGVNAVDLSPYPGLGLELGAAVGRLTELGSTSTSNGGLHLHGMPMLSGTLPPELGQLPKLDNLRLHNNPLLSGTIPPELGHSTKLDTLQLFNTRLSGTIPSELCNKMSFLRTLDLHDNTALSGTLPSLNATALTLLDAGNCSFSGLPPALPASTSHLYLNNNPLRTTAQQLGALLGSLPGLHVLDVGYMDFGTTVPLAPRGYNRGLYNGARVHNPTACHIGDSCEFVLHMYDSDDMPVHTGGLVAGLTLVSVHIPVCFEALRRTRGCESGYSAYGYTCVGLWCAAVDPEWSGTYAGSCATAVGRGWVVNSSSGRCVPPPEPLPANTSAPMHDNRDGTFTAAIPTSWVDRKGSRLFHFEGAGGAEFRPMFDAENAEADHGPNYDYPSLRTVEFLPRQCKGSHTVPDQATGATCVCEEGFEEDTGTNSSTLSCHKMCEAGEAVSSDGGTCRCTGTTYDTTRNGILNCSAGGWTAPDLAAHKQTGRCAPCTEECFSCENGVATMEEGWRLNSTSAAALTTQLAAGAGGKLQQIFRCPSGAYGQAPACPAARLYGSALQSSALECAENHTGVLCAACKEGFWRNTGDGKCTVCTTVTSTQVISAMGLGLFVASLLGLAWWQRARLKQAKVEVWTNIKISLGLAQVLSLLKNVLDLVFPPVPHQALSYAAVMTGDLRNLFSLECSLGWSFFDVWRFTVIGVPLVLLGVLGMRYGWQRRRMSAVEAGSNATSALFLVVLVLYPQVSSAILSAFNCRQLGASYSVLEADYRVTCTDPSSDDTIYSSYRVAAWVLLALIPVGIPLTLLALLMGSGVKQWSRVYSTADSHEGGLQRRVDSDAHQCVTGAQERYSFLLDDFRPGCWWFEPVDMLRKLLLSGLLQFVDRGTALQCFCGCCLAFLSLGLQLHVAPYLEPESNLLKACAEGVLFLAFLISFILRVMPGIEAYEPWHAEAYGWVLVGALALFVVTAIVLTTKQIVARRRFHGDMLAGISDIEGEDALGALTRGNSSQSAELLPVAGGGFSVGASGVTDTAPGTSELLLTRSAVAEVRSAGDGTAQSAAVGLLSRMAAAATSGGGAVDPDPTGGATQSDDVDEEPLFGSGGSGGGAFTVGQPQPAAAVVGMGLSRPASPSRSRAVASEPEPEPEPAASTGGSE